MPGWKSKLKQSATDMLKLPPDALLDVPRVTCVGGKTVVVENSSRLLKVEEQIVLLELPGQVLAIYGRDFEVTLVTQREVHVAGQINKLEFLTPGRDER